MRFTYCSDPGDTGKNNFSKSGLKPNYSRWGNKKGKSIHSKQRAYLVGLAINEKGGRKGDTCVEFRVNSLKMREI